MTTFTPLKLIPLILFFVFSTVLLNNSFAQEEYECELAGRWGGGLCYTVASEGEVACYGNGRFVEIANISAPANPEIVSSLGTESPVEFLEIRNEVLFIANEAEGLTIFDITDPADPQKISSLYLPGYESVFVLLDDLLFYGGNNSYGVRIVDISNLSIPSIISTVDINSVDNMEIHEQYLWCAREWDGLSAIDISNPEEPIQILQLDGNYIDVALKNEYLFAALTDSVKIFDITNIQEPQLINSILSTSYLYIQALNIENDILYLGESYNLRIFDIQNPESPSLLGEYSSYWNSYIEKIIINHGLAIVAKVRDGMEIIDISDLQNPEFHGILHAHGITRGVTIHDDKAFISRYYEGIRIVDVSDPMEPSFIGNYDTDGGSLRMVISDDLVYIADKENDLVILDVSDPSDPILLSDIDLDKSTFNLALNGNHVYLAQLEEGLVIIDVTDPSNPQVKGQLSTDSRIRDIAIVGNFAYLADWDAGFRIIDITDPENPVEKGYINDIGKTTSVAVLGNFALVGNTSGKLRVIDITDPQHPEEKAQNYCTRSIEDISIYDEKAYVSIGYGGVIILDISDPFNPIELNQYNTWGSVYEATAIGGYVYIADENAGMTIIRCDVISGTIDTDKTGSENLTAIPNPFENTTQIKTEFNIAEITGVSIHDLRGKLIYTFSKSYHSSMIWNGSDNNGQTVDPGIYICRIATTNSERTIKIIML